MSETREQLLTELAMNEAVWPPGDIECNLSVGEHQINWREWKAERERLSLEQRPQEEWPEERMDVIGSNGNDGIAYHEQRAEYPKQQRYQDKQGDDWIDECARTMTPEQFRGAMIFTVGKYLRRLGKKDAIESEVGKIADYAQRWHEYEKASTEHSA